MENPEVLIPSLLGAAWVLPLVSFVLILFFGKRMGKAGNKAATVATSAILGGFVLSLIALCSWLGREDTSYITGDWYTLAEFGSLKLTIGYYVDSLTVTMFCMVTLIATCIHFYASGYMHDELHDITDHEVTLANGEHLKRPGRFHRFFQYLSLFCFSMLGIVISGNIAMTFVFWELVGICSYFLIGFYIERKSASDAANKAFIVNRIGDMGMIIGLMAIFASLGTFNFGDIDGKAGMFTQVPVRSEATEFKQEVPDGMVIASARDRIAAGEKATPENIKTWKEEGYGYGLLIVAGLGIFCGCMGKSAQFPLHVWLPDAMEGPTPVSALVHSATMVAAGVFLAGRFFPVFTPEVLLVIACIGCITLFMAATIAITATDIKRVLAYSTLSQLGYMMFAIGVGGWVAGMLHLITHAFFKSLLFMCSGSVIHAVHSNEMTDMGGLFKKMPVTAITMLIGCLAIIGAGIPLVAGLSGYYSKDAILAQAFSFSHHTENPLWLLMFYISAGGAAITAFYMFRLWFMTFMGKPRDQKRYDHAHESPKVMTYPLIVLSVFAMFVASPPLTSLLDGTTSPLFEMLKDAQPESANAKAVGTWIDVTIPVEHIEDHEAHAEYPAEDAIAGEIVTPIEEHPTVHHATESTSDALLGGIKFLNPHQIAGLTAFATAFSGLLLAACMYWWNLINPIEVRDMFRPIHRFLLGKWWFDELYDKLFIQPTFYLSRFFAGIDKYFIDVLIDKGSLLVRKFCTGFDNLIDRLFIDGLVNWTAKKIFAIGLALRAVQTGKIRQYVVLIVVGTVTLFLVATFGFAN